MSDSGPAAGEPNIVTGNNFFNRSFRAPAFSSPFVARSSGVRLSAYVTIRMGVSASIAELRCMEAIMFAFLILLFSVVPSVVVAQADSARATADSAGAKSSGVFEAPVGIRVSPRADTTAHSRKEYHGLRWTLIGAAAGGLITGGATAYLVSACATGGDCRDAWRWIVIGTGFGAIVGGFLTGLVYGLFNG
jgi:hypothetical protein